MLITILPLVAPAFPPITATMVGYELRDRNQWSDPQKLEAFPRLGAMQC